MKKTMVFILSYVLLVLIFPLVFTNFAILMKQPILWNAFIYVILFILGIVLFREDLKSMLLKVRKRKMQVIMLSFVAFVAILVGTIALNLILNSWEVSQNQVAVNALLKNSTLAILIVVVFGPFVEELVFRHILIGKLSTKYPTWLTTIVSVLCFGLIHMKHLSLKGFTEISSYFVVGAVLSVLYLKKDKNVTYPLAAHVLNNLVSVLLSLAG